VTRKIELHLSYRCNRQCANCSTLCTQAPADLPLSVEAIKWFVDESIMLGVRWDLITLTGGEPTLVPNLLEICGLVASYTRHNQNCRVVCLSNGSNPRIMQAVADIGVEPGVSIKLDTNRNAAGPIPYVPVCVSPTDQGLPWTAGCFQSRDCGMALNNLGYWPCSPMAAAARVFGLYAVSETLGGISEAGLSAAMLTYCRQCGLSCDQPREIKQKTSPTWAAALERYNGA